MIRDHQGLATQFYGDGLMAIFPRAPENATAAAIDMHRAAAEVTPPPDVTTGHTLEIGVGLNTGPLTVGIIGDGKRADTTVVGDAVNCASRMEGLTKTYGARIIMSEQVRSGLADQHNVRFLDRVCVKGRAQPIAIYEIFDADDANLLALKLETLEAFEQGLAHYFAERFADAVKCFGEVLKVIPHDRATQLCLQRSARFLVDGVPERWRIGGTLAAPN